MIKSKRHTISEFWNYKRVLINFFLRDYKIFYRDTFLGFLWSFIQPFSISMVFYIIFNEVTRFQVSTDVPYSLIILSGISMVQFFSGSIGVSTMVLAANLPIMQKIYFPKYIPAVGKVLFLSIDFFIVLFFLIVVSMYKGVFNIFFLIYFPIFYIMTLAIISSLSILISFFCVLFKDIKFIVDFVLRIIFFISPIAYIFKNVPDKYIFFIYFNPLFSMIHLFRYVLFGDVYSELNISLLINFCVWFVGLIIASYYCMRFFDDRVIDL